VKFYIPLKDVIIIKIQIPEVEMTFCNTSRLVILRLKLLSLPIFWQLPVWIVRFWYHLTVC